MYIPGLTEVSTQAAGTVGGDLTILGLPVALVITMLVQLCKMLRMPGQWAPWASLVLGVLTASMVQLSRPNILDAPTIIYTLLLATSYALMANGIFAILVGSQDHVRSMDTRAAMSLVSFVSPPPPPIPEEVHPSAGVAEAEPEPEPEPAPVISVPAALAEGPGMHVIGGGEGSSPFQK